MKCAALLTFLALTATAAGAGTAQEAEQPVVAVYRIPQPPSTTIVEGMFRVDPVLLGTLTCNYTAEVTVRDAQGLAIREDKWDSSCPSTNGVPAPALELFRFAMPAGSTFDVAVAVYPKEKPTERRVRTIRVTALPDSTMVSDLVLAKQVGFMDSASESQWTLRRGTIGIRTSSEVVLQPDSAQLAYYFELYPRIDKPMTGTVQGIVRTSDGSDVTRIPLQQLDGVVDPRPIAGTANLAGLAPGSYAFDIEVALADTLLKLSHVFEMTQPAAVSYFYTVSDADIDSLFGGIEVWLTNKAESDLYKTLSATGKRAFLTRTFGPDAPTPDDGNESAIDAFVERSRAVQARFSERSGRGLQAGWKTDRGRVYLLHGEPSSQVTRSTPSSGSPYEIFYYAAGRGSVYLFADETRLGHYRLIYTNDPSQQSVVNWHTRVGSDAISDLQRLGVQVRID